MREKWNVPQTGLAAAGFASILVILSTSGPSSSIIAQIALTLLAFGVPITASGAIVNSYVTEKETRAGEESLRWTVAAVIGVGGDFICIVGIGVHIATVSVAAAVAYAASIYLAYIAWRAFATNRL